VEFVRANGVVVSREYEIEPVARVTVWANAIPELAGSQFWTRIHSDLPITAERAVYLLGTSRQWTSGHVVAGQPSPAQLWFFAEGLTGPSADTQVIVANPTDSVAAAYIRWLRPGGQPPIAEARTLAPMSRTVISADAVKGLKNTAFGMVVFASRPVIAERLVTWPGPRATSDESHGGAGLPSLGTWWLLAEGEIGGPDRFETYLLVLNPGARTAKVRFTFLREDTVPLVVERVVGAESRFTLDAQTVGLRSGERFGVFVESDLPVGVEHSLYWTAGGSRAGISGAGARLR
jgi:hypothetical protein